MIRQIALYLILGTITIFKVNGQQNNAPSDSLKKVELWYDDEFQVRRLKSIYYVLKDKQNIMHGKMVSYYETGKIISEGSYKLNEPYGEWRYYFENGDLKMRGDLTSNNTGYWEYYFESGNIKQEGKIINNKQEGLWKYYFENGKIKSQGAYLNGIKKDSWTYYYEDGNKKASATYINGIGKYKEYYESGALKMEGETINNQSEGIWTYYYPSGEIKSKGYELHGVKNGHWDFFHENGTKSSEGNYVDGKQHDNWKYYFENGHLNSEGYHYEGEKDGQWKLYHKNGAFKGEGIFNRGDGDYKEYYESGVLKIKGQVVNNENHGTWSYFYEDGIKEGECEFNNGKGLYTGYYKDGTIKMKGNIEGNNKTGTWELYNEDGTIAGYYKTIYTKDGDEIQSEIKEDKDTINSPPATAIQPHLPHYKYKAKRRSKIRNFQPRINELEGIILSVNPLGVVNTILPVFVEYYYQERLGYEMEYSIHRNPFFISDDKIPNNIIYNRGQSIEFAQRFYKPSRSYGMLYFGHRLRFKANNYYATVTDTVSYVAPLERIKATENTIEYLFQFGDRVFGNYRRPGFTFDIFVAAGLGYRWFDKQYTETPYRNRLFQIIPQKNIFIPYRLEFSFGYLF